MGKKNKLSTQLMSVVLLIALPLSSVQAEGPNSSGGGSEYELAPVPEINFNRGGGSYFSDFSVNNVIGQDPLLTKNAKSIIGPRLHIMKGTATEAAGAMLGTYNPTFRNLDLVSGACPECLERRREQDNSNYGLTNISDFYTDLPRLYCEFPEQFSISPFITSTDIETQGYRTSSDVDFCGCVGGVRQTGLSFYGDIGPAEARNFCQQAGEHLIKQKFDEHLNAIQDMGVLKTIAQAALGITDGKNICNGDASERIFKMTLGQDNAEGKRLCSSQSVAYIVNMMEKSGAGIIDGNRANEYVTMKVTADTLVANSDGSRSPAQVSAQSSFDSYVASSPIFSLKKSEYESVLSARVKEIFPEAQGDSFTPESIAALAGAAGNTKAVLARKIIDMIIQNSGLNSSYGKAQAELFNVEVSGDIDVKAMIEGRTPLTEDVADKLLKRFAQVSSNKCDRANENVVAQCKIVSSGLSFKPDTVASHRCALESNDKFRELIDNPLKIFKDIVENSAGFRHTASQLMCYQVLRHGTVMDDFISGSERSCDPETNQSRLEGLTDSLSIPGGVESTFLGDRHMEVVAAISDCSPFKVGALGDEAKPFTDASNFTEYMGQVVEDADSGTVADTQRTIIIAQQNGQDVSSAVRNSISGGGRGARIGGSTIGANNPNARISRRDAISQINENAARSAAEGGYSVPSEDFYSAMGTNQIQSVPDFSNFNVSEPSSSSASNSSSSSSSEDPLIAERRRIDEYLELLQQREAEYKEMVENLQRLGIKDVINDEGERVPVEDAFAATNAKIESQRALAMKEREELEQRLRGAEDSLATGQGRQSIASNAGSSDESRPIASSTPNNGAGASGSSASRSIASIGGSSGGSSGGSVSSGGVSSSSSDQYGPAPYQGIVLTSEELSIAKPQLDLGGRSLNDSVDIVRAAIEAVKGEVRLPVQYVNGKPVLDYILQEQDGKTVMVYLDGGQVVVADVNLAVDSVQDKVVVEVTPEAASEAPAEPELRAPAQSGRKAWADVEAILDGAQ